jgi:hypothetical protein
MKALKIMLGAFFALWAIAMLPGGIKIILSSPSFAVFVLNVGAGIVAIGLVVMFSHWSFESALRKPAPDQNPDPTDAGDSE